MTLNPHLKLPPLRWLMMVDTLLVAGFALVLVALAIPLANAMDLPVNLVRGAGLVLVPWTAFLAITWRREPPPRHAVATIVAVNGAWVAASLGLLAGGLVEPNALGIAFIVFQAAGVLLLAMCQFAHWRSMP